MKNYNNIIITILFALIFSVGLTSCEDDDVYQEKVKVTFWNNQSSVGTITVNVGSGTAKITKTKVATECSTSGCANFSATKGTSYSWSASSTTGEFWSGTNRFNQSCTTFQLY